MLSQFQVTQTIDLEYFDAWVGAASRLDELKYHAQAFEFVNELLADGSAPDGYTDVQINDFLWFELDQLLEEYGYYNGETGLWYDDEGFEPVESAM